MKGTTIISVIIVILLILLAMGIICLNKDRLFNKHDKYESGDLVVGPQIFSYSDDEGIYDSSYDSYNFEGIVNFNKKSGGSSGSSGSDVCETDSDCDAGEVCNDDGVCVAEGDVCETG